MVATREDQHKKGPRAQAAKSPSPPTLPPQTEVRVGGLVDNDPAAPGTVSATTAALARVGSTAASDMEAEDIDEQAEEGPGRTPGKADAASAAGGNIHIHLHSSSSGGAGGGSLPPAEAVAVPMGAF